MKIGFLGNRTLCFISIVLSLTGIFLQGCTPSSNDALRTGPNHVGVLTLLDAWERVAGSENSFASIELRNGSNSDETILFESQWGAEDLLHAHLRGTAKKDTGQVIQLSVFGSAQGEAFTEEKVRFLKPFADTLLAVMVPSLSKQDRENVLSDMAIDGNRGSEEGGTIEFIASLVEVGR